MKASKAITILDPYDWLPGYGETSVELRMTREGNLNLYIYYDGPNNIECKKTIVFKKPCAYCYALMGTRYFMSIKYEPDNEPMSNLICYSESEIADAIKNEFPYREIKHYLMYFMGDESSLTVFAENVSLVDD